MTHSMATWQRNMTKYPASLSPSPTDSLYVHIAFLESEALYYERTSRYDLARSAYRDIASTLRAIDDITSSPHTQLYAR